jgi:K+-transporting ATPase ATPase C chain
MNNALRPALAILLSLTLLTGGVYPLVVTGFAQLFFPGKAAGSLIVNNGKAIGSTLIGQHFSDPKYFWSRPSATAPYANNAIASVGSNLGPLNPALVDAVKARIDALKAVDPTNTSKIPVDLVTASASGLDPHISVAAAEYQVARMARVRGLEVAKVRELVAASTEGRWLGFLGEPRVNVLLLNLTLDKSTRP